MFELDESLLKEFLVECQENLETLDKGLLDIESNPEDTESIFTIFRAIHTIKGSCGFFEMTRLEKVAHSAESVLDKMRAKQLDVSSDGISLLLKATDKIKEILTAIEDTNEEPGGSDEELIAELKALWQAPQASTEAAPAEASPQAEQASVEAPSAEPDAQASNDTPEPEASTPAAETSEPAVEEAPTPAAEAPQAPLEEAPEPASETPEVSAEEAPAPAEELAQVPAVEAPSPANETPQAPVEKTPAPAAQAPEPPAEKAPEKAPASPAGKKKTSATDQSLRVNIELLEKLMNMVGELVLTRNQLLQSLNEYEGENDIISMKFKAPLQGLNRITSDLQEGVMKTRMSPIGNAWAKLPRIVRDVAQMQQKDVRLVMSGEDTELDRAVTQAIQDPLVHMVRNAVDHGLEPPDQRTQSGKPHTGTINLDAYHEGGNVIIEIRDDGKGIDPEKIKNKAIEKGLLTAEDAENLTENKILEYIFKSGFSTAEQVTNISGRGVGMDVVRTNIEQIGGTVDLSSKVGFGSTVRIKIPLTLAIISGLICQVQDDLFVLPQMTVLELVRISKDTSNLVEEIPGGRVLRLRDRLLPMVELSDILGFPKTEQTENQSKELVILVLQVEDKSFGLVVDEVYDTQEIVVKPIGKLMKNLDIYSGATILGDGRVIMILDAVGIGHQSGALSITDTLQNEAQGQGLDQQGESVDNDKMSVVLFESGEGAIKGVPLSLVARLEEFTKDQIEYTEGRIVVQYRNTLLPLIPCHEGFNIDELEEVPVIVFSDGERNMGLLIKQVKDIVSEHVNIETAGNVEGILGVTVICGQATEIIDAYHFLKVAYPNWFENSQQSLQKTPRVLVADDSAFILDLVRSMLDSVGYQVVTANDGLQALDILAKDHQNIDLVLSDIEMPNMDGFGLVEAIRKDPELSYMPVIALTTLDSAEHRERGKAAGFQEYLIKFDRDAVLKAIVQCLTEGKEVTNEQ